MRVAEPRTINGGILKILASYTARPHQFCTARVARQALSWWHSPRDSGARCSEQCSDMSIIFILTGTCLKEKIFYFQTRHWGGAGRRGCGNSRRRVRPARHAREKRVPPPVRGPGVENVDFT